MLIPSIDIQRGNAVQLVGGKVQALDAGDPRPIARKFDLIGETAVIDLDAARGLGSNELIIEELCGLIRCRVGGGIRTFEAAMGWLDRGAEKIILGTAATPDVLKQLPKNRVIAALDAVDGEIYIHGWQRATGVNVFDRMRELEPYVGGFLVTTIEREGRLVGADLKVAELLRSAAGSSSVTLAGGIATAEEVALLDKMEIDAQVGMALYTGVFDLADAIVAIAGAGADQLIPTVIVDERGVALGLAHSNLESIRRAIETTRGVYWSRRNGLWDKGQTSGNWQELLAIDLDCDRDALRFTVRQMGDGFCHKNTYSCWGNQNGLGALASRIEQSVRVGDTSSYTRKVLSTPGMLAGKIMEEAREFTEAEIREEVIHEASDLLYFIMIGLSKAGVRIAEVERMLDLRGRKLTRRSGEVKNLTRNSNA